MKPSVQLASPVPEELTDTDEEVLGEQNKLNPSAVVRVRHWVWTVGGWSTRA
jgi:hypothetical protein